MSTKLPDAVQRQLEEAEALEAQLTTPQPDPAPEPPAAEPPPAPPEPPPAPEPTAEDWKQKYLTLQGKYNAEVPQLRSDVAQLKQRITELTRQPSPQPEPPKAPEPPPKLVTDKDADAFGADLIDLIRRAATEAYGPEKARLEAEIAELKAKLPGLEGQVKTVATAQGDASRATYWTGLAGKVADYEEINASQEFLSWLEGSDPMSGIVRNAILQDAFTRYDVERTAAIFNAFKATKPPAPQPDLTVPPKNELEALVSPGTSKTTSTTPVDAKKMWTPQEVQNFYSAVTKGEFKDKAAEAARIDAEIDAAFAEGRVRP